MPVIGNLKQLEPVLVTGDLNRDLKQGDLLLVELTGYRYGAIPTIFRGEMQSGEGWLLVQELATDGGVTHATFCPKGGTGGYGGVHHPGFEAKALIRGKHGECSPFAALTKIFGSRAVAVAMVT